MKIKGGVGLFRLIDGQVKERRGAMWPVGKVRISRDYIELDCLGRNTFSRNDVRRIVFKSHLYSEFRFVVSTNSCDFVLYLSTFHGPVILAHLSECGYPLGEKERWWKSLSARSLIF